MLGKDTFYYNIIRKYIVAFGSLFNDIHVIRKDENDEELKDIRVPITFASKDKARYQINSLHSKIKDKIKIAQILPRISYTLTAIDFDTTRLLNATHHRVAHIDSIPQSVTELPVGKPFSFMFQVSIWTKYIDDMFQIVEQALSFFNPDYHLTIKEVPELNVETEIPVIFRSCAPTFETEFDESSWRVVRFDIDFELKGWIYPALAQESIIHKIKLNFYDGIDQDKQISLYQSEYDEAELEILSGLYDNFDSEYQTILDNNSVKGYEQETLNVYKQETEPVLLEDENAAYWTNTLSGQKFYLYKKSGIQQIILIE